MASTYVNDLRLNEMATGDASGTWGEVTNTNLELIAEAFSYGTEAITTNADTHTTTIADGATDPGRSMYLKYTGTLDSACTITIGPNTVSKLWFIENATSGSQNIIISQGSGANITIPPGDVKVVYSDGAGSGAAVTDAFASLNVVDLKVQDDLTVTDDLIVNGDIDLEGNMDVNGTLETDALSLNGTTVTSTAAEINLLDGSSANTVVNSKAVIYGSSGEVAGTLSTAAQGNITSLGTLTTLTVDDITINGSTISDAGDLTLDIGGDIILDAAGDQINFKSGGTSRGYIDMSTGGLVLRSLTSDADIIIQGTDGASSVNAVTFDMSNAGKAIFNAGATFGSGIDVTGTVTADGVEVDGLLHIDGSDNSNVASFALTRTDASWSIDNETNFRIYGNTGDTTNPATKRFEIGTGGDISFYEDTGTSQALFWDASAESLGIGTTSPNAPLEATKAITFSNADTIGQFLIKSAAGATGDMLNFGVDSTNSLAFMQANEKGTDTIPLVLQRYGGNVGIGTDSPSAKLTISGSVRSLRADSTSQYGDFGQDSSGGFLIQHRPHASLYENFRFLASNNSGTVERMRINSSGNVGIGVSDGDVTSDGSAARTYVGIIGTANRGRLNLGSTASNGADSGVLSFVNGANELGNILMDTNSGSQTVGKMYINSTDVLDIRAAGGVVFNEGSADADFRVESNGNANMLFVDGGNDNVGIGTGSPNANAKLHVEGTGDSQILIYETGTSPYTSTLKLASQSTTDYGANVQYTSGAEQLTIENFGRTINSTSAQGSIRFRTKVGNSGMQEVLHINGYTGNVGIGASSVTDKLEVVTAGSASTENALRLTNPFGFSGTGNGVALIFAQDRSDAEDYPMAKIQSYQSNSGSSNEGDLDIYTRNGGSLGVRASFLSGGGIAFNGDRSQSNALDDYEEGTWTPAYNNGGTVTYTTQEGRYTKIGRLVHLVCEIDVNTVSGTNGSAMQITGAPFTNNGPDETGGSVGINLSGWLNSEGTDMIQINATDAVILPSKDTTNDIFRGTDIGTGFVCLSVTYTTDQ